MSRATGRTAWPGYAICPNQPSKEMLEDMERCGIKWVKGTLTEFVDECKKALGEIPQSLVLEISHITVHGKSVKLGRDVESNILTKMHPLRKSHFERHLEPLQFLSLNEWAFEPYLLGYDFPRKFRFKHLTKGTIPVVSNAREFVKARANIDSSDKKIFCLAGSAGSGKSIIARRIAVEWYRESGNPVIFFDPPLVLDKKVLLDLMKEITKDYYKYFGEEDAQDERFGPA